MKQVVARKTADTRLIKLLCLPAATLGLSSDHCMILAEYDLSSLNGAFSTNGIGWLW